MKLKMSGEVYSSSHTRYEPYDIGNFGFCQTMAAIEEGARVKLTIEGQAGHVCDRTNRETFTGLFKAREGYRSQDRDGWGSDSPGAVDVGEYDIVRALKPYVGNYVTITVEDAEPDEATGHVAGAEYSIGGWPVSCPPAEVISLAPEPELPRAVTCTHIREIAEEVVRILQERDLVVSAGKADTGEVNKC